MNIQALYETDFNSWIQENILLLKQSRFNEIDADHLIEELEDMAKKDRRELMSRFIVLIAHLLKWQYQATHRSNSWRSSIDENRVQIEVLLDDVPSLKADFSDAIKDAYQKAVKLAAKETGLKQSNFPVNCSYTEQQLLNEDFYPES